MLSFPPSPQVKIYVCRKPVDMRKSFSGLSGAVIDVVDHDPQSGHLFLFFNKRRTMRVWGSGRNALVAGWEAGEFTGLRLAGIVTGGVRVVRAARCCSYAPAALA